MRYNSRNMSKPKFKLYEIVYSRISAMKGFIEPLVIGSINYENQSNTYEYRWIKNKKLSELIITGRINHRSIDPPSDKSLSPVRIAEHELIYLCQDDDNGALQIQKRFIEKELLNASNEILNSGCDEIDEFPDVEKDKNYDYNDDISSPNWSVGDFVYLRETAESVGRLERFRIDNIEFNNKTGEWVYVFFIKQKPGAVSTVVDRNDLKNNIIISKSESELIDFCDAMAIRILYLNKSLDTVNRRIETLCQDY